MINEMLTTDGSDQVMLRLESVGNGQSPGKKTESSERSKIYGIGGSK
jgi:hypothetical protein